MASPAEIVVGQGFRPLKRVEYERLAAEGFFDDERVELLFGLVVEMAPLDPPHCASVVELDRILHRAIGDRALVRCQTSFAATEDSEPQPDLYVCPVGDYWREHPTRADLVVEVSWSSQRRDRGPKAALYGISDVAEYWIVDLVAGVIEVYRDRHDGTWRSKDTYRRGDVVAMQAFPDVEVRVSAVVPPVV